MYFSQRFSKEFKVPREKLLPFFENEFQLCLIGKADLKDELKKYLDQWGWEKSIDDLLSYWFINESNLDEKIIKSVNNLRKQGIKCYLDTNNEKYRVQYLIEDLGLKDLFDGVFSSCRLGYKKPQPEFWSAIYNQLGRPNKKEVLVWDDNKENIASAENFGFYAEFYANFEAYEKMTNLLMPDVLKI
jgi:putative hydrolase of the HAD superfamily